jgi:hypothetical protein
MNSTIANKAKIVTEKRGISGKIPRDELTSQFEG